MSDIELVIKIPEEDYMKLHDNEEVITLSCNMIDVIRKGTQLPKGHGNLFDENKLKKEAIRCEWTSSMYYTLDHTLSYMKPIIEADNE